MKYTGTAGTREALSQSSASALSAPWPNPTPNHARIEYELPSDGPVTLAVYSVQGQLVRILEAGQQRAGRHSTEWDGTDAAGKSVASGVYFYIVRTPSGEQSRKSVMLR